MYKYEIEKLTNWSEHQQLFDVDFPEMSEIVGEFINGGRIIYFMSARENGKLIGTMGVMKLEEDRDGDYSEDAYKFFHLVVGKDYRNQGVAKGLIRMCVKFLIGMGAKKIYNHKRENVIKHKVFTDLGFDLVKYDEKETDYKWNYELDVEKVDKLNIEGICEEYETN